MAHEAGYEAVDDGCGYAFEEFGASSWAPETTWPRPASPGLLVPRPVQIGSISSEQALLRCEADRIEQALLDPEGSQ